MVPQTLGDVVFSVRVDSTLDPDSLPRIDCGTSWYVVCDVGHSISGITQRRVREGA